MTKADPAAALDARDTELLRDLRSRMTRMPPSKPAQVVLGAAFLKACARVGLEPKADAPSAPVTLPLVVNAAAPADLEQLRSLVSVLAAIRREHPQAFADLFAAGAGQAVLTRRLVLAGREHPKDRETAA